VWTAHDQTDAAKFGVELPPVLNLKIEWRHRSHASHDFPGHEKFLVVEDPSEDHRRAEFVARDASCRKPMATTKSPDLPRSPLRIAGELTSSTSATVSR
jgi:hypothetical protein